MIAFAPDGNPIDVALQQVDVRDGVFRKSFSRDEDDSVDFQFDSHNEIVWDNTRPITRDGEPTFVSTGGEICKESELLLVPHRWRATLDSGKQEVFEVDPHQIDDPEHFGFKKAGDIFVGRNENVDPLDIRRVEPISDIK